MAKSFSRYYTDFSPPGVADDKFMTADKIPDQPRKSLAIQGHGFILATSFMVIVPLSILSIHFKSKGSKLYSQLLQCASIIVNTLGAIIGVMVSMRGTLLSSRSAIKEWQSDIRVMQNLQLYKAHTPTPTIWNPSHCWPDCSFHHGSEETRKTGVASHVGWNQCFRLRNRECWIVRDTFS